LPRNFPQAEIAAAAGATPLRWESVRGGGYATNTDKWTVDLDDDRRVFVKFALDELAAGWLRDESRIYMSLAARFLPKLVAWHDVGGVTFLVVEDLSNAHWPPPWSQAQISLVLETLAAVHATGPPPGLVRLETLREKLDGWPTVSDDPEPFLSVGLCSSEWLDGALPALAQASSDCELAGDALLHTDVRSDNLCFHGERAVLVDWNLACIGKGLFDAVAWAPSLRFEGGPEPWELVPDSEGLAALVAGYWAARVGMQPPATAPKVREVQRRQLEVTLPWVARELGLPAVAV